MRFVLASYGTRGDVEPCAALGRELAFRRHDVRVAVPPNLVSFVESAGLEAVAYGSDSQATLESDFFQNLWKGFPRNLWTKELARSWRDTISTVEKHWPELTRTLVSLAEEADLLLSGHIYEHLAANVAEYLGIPFATLHPIPFRPNGHWIAGLPPPVVRSGLHLLDWMNWLGIKKLEATQRSNLGLPKATVPATRRIAERKSLEIQAYDEICYPGLAAEWARWQDLRPFVGAMTMGLSTIDDEDVAAWIGAGTPPIYFGFGSMPTESPDDTIAMIAAACAELGERALICAAGMDDSRVAHPDDVKVVGATSYAAAFPACRAVVHHGGAGTTALALRAGIPQLILSTDLDQTLWGVRIKRLKVGTKRRFSTTTSDSLLADLRTILGPQYVSRAREMAARMTDPAESVSAAADLVEDFARLRSTC
ncbi:glycosyl transferase family 1 [Mycobacterium sp. E136]|uniref:glycosyltransferase n=1 Tax=Mycobacterium sp. E136 TaxID=1834125 RepID=UPI0007FC20BE|nr:glycosyltransferase [Mycobacterium sp. E136]OBG84351.1 glycosyl transferase family 1 [Mycobacterium sp. E136]